MADEVYYYESRFICRLCNKKFPCGKSLGGHMRSHVVANSAESDDFFEQKRSFFDNFGTMKDSEIAEFGNGQQSNYVLRRNPKKTWRAVVNSRFPSPQDKICKQCGKGFQSMKALCGHMACHSDRDKNLKDDSSWTSENQKPVFDSCTSDTEEGEERRITTRSSFKNKRYDKFVENFAPANNNNNSNVNGSSSVSEIDGQDQEEVAMCLMMLSRDFENYYYYYSVVESSDNNSVVLETKSSSIGKMESLNYIHNKDFVNNNKLKGKIMDDDNARVEGFDSDSGYFLDECGKADSDLSVNGFRKFKNEDNNGLEFNKRLKGIKNSSIKDDVASKRNYFTSERKTDEFHDNPKKTTSKYECYNCKKIFKSYQALGGHRPCHKRTHESRYESGENSLDRATDDNKNKSSVKKMKRNKNQGHVCPFCDRVFKNGQALGGHKRSHFIGGHENRNQRRVVKTDGRGLLDLNLPAPEDDGDNTRGKFDFS